ncbi:MAG: Rne/Rng family ribonuclease [Candidatus Eremiobacteraeota bacterium]|nr:Rne/Rng family ribonuclease [Candidatus Eremiobacteraeota bacterium]
MKTEILISCDEWENRVAVLEEGSLAEIYFEREEKVIGSIYKGRVENVLPGMGACFVNIGLGRNAFLYVDDIMRDPINIGETEITDRRRGHTVGELLKVGSEVLVQIVKEPRGLKGARVSTNVSLPGRYLVLMPTGRYSGVSSRIEDPQERERLKQIMRRVRPEGMATIVRTAAAGVSEAELIADLGVQLRLWHGILDSYKRATAPALLHKDLNLVFKAVRDFLTSDVSAVYIDSKEQYDEIRSTMSLLGPQYIDRLKLVDGPGTLFAQRGIDEELQKLLKPKIPLPSGGHLVLEHTEALTVIDVNTGKFTGGKNLEDTIVRTNIEAAAEIARQVRLRDIGGIIVVDFIDMTHERNREQVIQTLTEALHRDRTRSTIQEFSNLGLLEFTRKRVGKDLAGQLRSDCPYCTGLGNVMSSETVAIGVLRQIRNRIARNGTRKLDVVTDPGVATQLLGWYKDEFEKLGHDHDVDIALYVEPGRHREQVVVEESRRMRMAPLPGSTVETDMLSVRLPNPASGVAEVNGYLIEVKDAANATGQTVKLRIDAVEGNRVLAELAEPLPSAGRRRRGRGRGKEALPSEAPIAPPAPSLREIPAVDERRTTADRHERTRLRRPEAVAFSVADDEEEAPRVAAAPSRAKEPARGARGRPVRGGDGAGRDQRRRTRGGRGASTARSQALVVGGEGEVDYDDGDEDTVVATPTSGHARPLRAHDAETTGADGATRKRRRRRGRGGRGRGGDRQPGEAARADRNGDADYDEDEASATVVPRTSRPGEAPRTRREASPNSYDEDEDELSTVTDSRETGTHRPQRRYGPVRQLYGRPMDFDESRVRGGRTGREETREARDRGESARGTQRRQTSYRPADEYDEALDVVVKPKGPAAIPVDYHGDVAPRRRPSRDEETTEQAPPRKYDRGRRGRERDSGPRTEREKRPAHGRDREGRGGRFGGRSRDAGRAPKAQGPAIKQLYPPPDQQADVETRADNDDAPVRNPGFGRQPRGPLRRPSDAPPVPKGKVRQLYPPPPEPDEAASMTIAKAPIEDDGQFEDVGFSPARDEHEESLFVSDAEERDERRRRARERAESRRRSEESPSGADPSRADQTQTRPGEDEWPVF